jgi:hypothetical protein
MGLWVSRPRPGIPTPYGAGPGLSVFDHPPMKLPVYEGHPWIEENGINRLVLFYEDLFEEELIHEPSTS